MWNKGQALAVCTLAAAWWSIFYPELCFTEETCEAVRIEETDGTAGKLETGKADEAAGKIEAGEVWQASVDNLVISSKFLEWCQEHLTAEKE